jgi:hypothetical protein
MPAKFSTLTSTHTGSAAASNTAAKSGTTHPHATATTTLSGTPTLPSGTSLTRVPTGQNTQIPPDTGSTGVKLSTTAEALLAVFVPLALIVISAGAAQAFLKRRAQNQEREHMIRESIRMGM